ncbi:DsbA family oxidoreductase [Xylophilus sp.]|uniref:DsbA family oxidoreductase n=1 Tax=Xylophilus sp. TaxID=2653893 RepID=UPI0013BD4D72|nr:DsbA family oxidoreductase [Xylophilus sp.]KAF1043904.1 MAG: hypothetical protein GAK38_03791 [Xylophilus sp.]
MAAVQLKIDIVSDVVCPWCAVGIHSLERALDTLRGEVEASLHLEPYELNPDIAPEGEDVVEHLHAKYGSTAAQIQANGEAITRRGAAVGFTFHMDRRDRIVNTFDAHRLLYWAAEEGAPSAQLALKHALLRAYFTDGQNPSDHAVRLRLADEVGLDGQRAQEVLETDAFDSDVRTRENFFRQRGISGVPAVIVNNRHLIQGGQPPEVFAQALRQIAAARAATATAT